MPATPAFEITQAEYFAPIVPKGEGVWQTYGLNGGVIIQAVNPVFTAHRIYFYCGAITSNFLENVLFTVRLYVNGAVVATFQEWLATDNNQAGFLSSRVNPFRQGGAMSPDCMQLHLCQRMQFNILGEQEPPDMILQPFRVTGNIDKIIVSIDDNPSPNIIAYRAFLSVHSQ